MSCVGNGYSAPPVVWALRARRAVDDALTYIAHDSPQAAADLAARVIERAESLATLFERGRIVPELADPSLYEPIVGPYRLGSLKRRFTMPKHLVLFLALLVVAPSTSSGQELPTAQRLTGGTWYRMTFARFKPGAADEALRIIYDHFIKADEASGRDPIALDFVTGEWHHAVMFPLQDGPEDLAWSLRPIDERWWAELARLEGGAEQARALLTRFTALIATQKTDIVYRRR
jgi:plasmid stabilization system protein ParE